MGLRSSDDPYVPENVEIMALREENARLRNVLRRIENMYPDGCLACDIAREALDSTSARRGDGT